MTLSLFSSFHICIDFNPCLVDLWLGGHRAKNKVTFFRELLGAMYSCFQFSWGKMLSNWKIEKFLFLFLLQEGENKRYWCHLGERKSRALSCKCVTQKALNLNCLTLNPVNYSKLQGHLNKSAWFFWISLHKDLIKYNYNHTYAL